MFKIIHLSDIHNRNTIRHDEYRFIFNKLYEKARELKPDYIVLTGDIAHTKTQISPEYVDLTSELFKNLADITETHIILGNHDKNYKNSGRLDAVSPIVKALNNPNIHLHLKSGEYIVNKDLTFNIMNVFDRENWISPTDNKKVNIALYHGSVSGCDTDIGWTMEHGEDDISIFKDMDYAFLGDVHKTNQILDDEGKCRYVGSLIQQNHGETNDKGFLVWDIEDKNKFSVEHIAIPNPKPFITIELNDDGTIPEQDITSLCRLRVIANTKLPLDTIRKSIDVIKTKYKPEHLTFLDKSIKTHKTDNIIEQFHKEDLRDVKNQERLIKDYLTDYKISDVLLNKVYEINKKYNSIIENKETTARNIDFQIIRFEWDNLFNYGPKNSIDLYKLNGIVGIFGKNYSGKSSIID